MENEPIDLDDLTDLGPLNAHGYAENLTGAQARFLAEQIRPHWPEKAEEFDAIARRIDGALN